MFLSFGIPFRRSDGAGRQGLGALFFNPAGELDRHVIHGAGQVVADGGVRNGRAGVQGAGEEPAGYDDHGLAVGKGISGMKALGGFLEAIDGGDAAEYGAQVEGGFFDADGVHGLFLQVDLRQF